MKRQRWGKIGSTVYLVSPILPFASQDVCSVVAYEHTVLQVLVHLPHSIGLTNSAGSMRLAGAQTGRTCKC